MCLIPLYGTPSNLLRLGVCSDVTAHRVPHQAAARTRSVPGAAAVLGLNHSLDLGLGATLTLGPASDGDANLGSVCSPGGRRPLSKRRCAMAVATVVEQNRACLDACAECQEACETCVYNCCVEEAQADCARLCLDCATICAGCVQLLSRGSQWAAQLCELCALVCDACAAECEKFDNKHCRECAKACRRCAAECRSMAA
ncbi:four-helix bundle copper-binding protein [Mycobacterium avium]|nr:four-helix bundle copper-binding protein [Mycobacterium avium]